MKKIKTPLVKFFTKFLSKGNFVPYIIKKDFKEFKFYALRRETMRMIFLYDKMQTRCVKYTYVCISVYLCGIPKDLVTILNPHTLKIIHYRHLIDFLSIFKKINKIITNFPKKNRTNGPLLTQVFLPYVTDYAELTEIAKGHSRIRLAFAIS